MTDASGPAKANVVILCDVTHSAGMSHCYESVSKSETVLIADSGSHRILSLNPKTRIVLPPLLACVLALTHTRTDADQLSVVAASPEMNAPSAVCWDKADGMIYVTDEHSVLKVDPKGLTRKRVMSVLMTCSCLTGDATRFLERSPPPYLLPDLWAIVALYCSESMTTRIAGNDQQGQGFSDGIRNAAQFRFPCGIVCVSDHSILYVADFGNDRIRKVNRKNGAVTTAVGDGQHCNRDGNALDSSIRSPCALLFDPKASPPESIMYIGCYEGVRRWNLISGLWPVSLVGPVLIAICLI